MNRAILHTATLACFLAASAAAQVATKPSPAQLHGAPLRRPAVAAPRSLPQIQPASTLLPPAAPLVGGADSCVTPDVISGTGNFAFDNTIATTSTEGQAEAICNFFGFQTNIRDVWFTWVAPVTTTATVTTCGLTTIDTKIAIYNGSTCPTGAAIACNDDSCAGLFQTTLTFPCVMGNSYVIQLGNSAAPPPSTPGAGTFSINATAPSTNDDCSMPLNLVGTGLFPFNNTSATTGTQGQAEALCNLTGAGMTILQDLWFTWTATQTGIARVNTCGFTTVDTKIAIYNGSGCPAASALACNDDACAGFQTTVEFPCILGNVYTIQLGLYPGTAPVATPGSGNVEIQTFTPPANDDCSAPTSVSGSGPFPFDNALASTGTQGQTEPLCGGTSVDKDVWYTWVAPFSGTFAAQTLGLTNLDTKVAVYDGAGCPAGAAIACDDDANGGAVYVQSQAIFTAVGGQSYTIQLGLASGVTAGGQGEFSIVPVGPPSNDDCSTPITISGAGPHFFDNTFATTGTQGQAEALCTQFGMPVVEDVWYRWTPANGGSATLSFCNLTETDTKVVVYDGTGCPVTAALACNDDFCAFQSEVSFTAVCGQQYTIQIGVYPLWGAPAGGQGRFTINVSGTGCNPSTAFCFGDGSGTLCPCQLAAPPGGTGPVPPGAAGNGCPNSLNPNGANLTAIGTASVAADSVTISGSGMPNSTCLYFQGTTKLNAGNGSVFGDGLRCAGGTVIRLGTKTNVGGTSSYPVGPDLAISVKGLVPGTGGTREYQCWYRNSALFCVATSTFNLTNGIEIVWQP